MKGVLVQLDLYIFLIERHNNSLLNEFRIELGIEKYILNGAWNVLILPAFYQGVFPEFLFQAAIVAIQYIAVLFVAVYLFGIVYLLTKAIADALPSPYFAVVIYKILLVVGAVNKPETHPSLRLEGHDTIGTGFSHHFKDQVGISKREVIFIECFFAFFYAQL